MKIIYKGYAGKEVTGLEGPMPAQVWDAIRAQYFPGETRVTMPNKKLKEAGWRVKRVIDVEESDVVGIAEVAASVVGGGTGKKLGFVGRLIGKLFN